MIYLKKITSLNNLKSNLVRGQISTILILIMVALIIFILVTLNIGSTSVKATQLANAADSAVMYLASVLATQSHYIYVALGNSYSYCVKGGLLVIVLAVIAAVICTILQQHWYWIVLASMLAGMTGGAIVQGTLKGAVMGALQGAAIGAAFAGGAFLGASIGGQLSGTCILSSITSTGISGVAAAAVTIGAVGLGAITTAAAAYNTSVGQQNNVKTMDAITKQLTFLPDYEGTREGVFLQALQQTVDDPNKTNPNGTVICGGSDIITDSNGNVLYNHPGGYEVTGGDPDDLNDNGITNEPVNCFSYWWHNHLQAVKNNVGSYEDLIIPFFENYLIPFYKDSLSFMPYMDRREIECSCLGGAESPMNTLFRALYNSAPCTYSLADANPNPNQNNCSAFNSAYNMIWKPGLTRNGPNGLLTYYNCASSDPSVHCNAIPTGWSEYDSVRMTYEDFIDYAKGVLKPSTQCNLFNYNPNTLSKKLRNRYNAPPVTEQSWDWFDPLYNDPNNGADFSHKLQGIACLMENWVNRITTIRDSLPGCKLSYSFTNIPISKQAWGAQTNCADPYYTPFTLPAGLTLSDVSKNASIYPCNWQLSTGGVSGPYFPNPICKVYSGDKTTLDNEITAVQAAVSTISVANIIANYYNNGYPCPSGATPLSQGGCDLVGPLTVNDIQVWLPGASGSSCSANNLGSGTVTLYYDWYFDYTCKCCSPPSCSGNQMANCDGTNPPSPTCGGQCCHATACGDCNDGYCSYQCLPDNVLCCTTPETRYYGRHAPVAITVAAADLSIPQMGLSDFSGAVTAMLNYIAPLSPTFATIDQDNADEFQPVLDSLSHQISEINNFFLPQVEQFYYDISHRPNYRAVTGAGNVTYSWADTACTSGTDLCHSVKVETGNFLFPSISHTWSNFIDLVNKNCWNLDHGKDDNGKRAWVEITRTDPGERIIHSSGLTDLGLKWNPSQGQTLTIKRKSRAKWSATGVSIAGVN